MIDLIRKFVATVTYADGHKVTITAYGSNATAAEASALAERKADGAVYVIVHRELYS